MLGINFITYKSKEPKKALIRHEYEANVCKVLFVMQDKFGNKYEDTTTLGNKRGKYYYQGHSCVELIGEFLGKVSCSRKEIPISLDKKVYTNIEIVTAEIIDAWTENDYYLEEVVSPEQI